LVAISRAYYHANKEQNAKKCREYRQKNAVVLAEKKRIYRLNNLDALKEKNRIYYQANIEEIREKKRAYSKTNAKNLTQKKCVYLANRLKNDPLFALKVRIRSLIRVSLKNRNQIKNSRANEILGCSYEEFKTHIENQFTDGMHWEKMGREIHLDHIIPMASAKTEFEVIALNHYTNFQPLWAIDNLKKGAKMPHELKDND
jgi:hypothetical protein